MVVGFNRKKILILLVWSFYLYSCIDKEQYIVEKQTWLMKDNNTDSVLTEKTLYDNSLVKYIHFDINNMDTSYIKVQNGGKTIKEIYFFEGKPFHTITCFYNYRGDIEEVKNEIKTESYDTIFSNPVNNIYFLGKIFAQDFSKAYYYDVLRVFYLYNGVEVIKKTIQKDGDVIINKYIDNLIVEEQLINDTIFYEYDENRKLKLKKSKHQKIEYFYDTDKLIYTNEYLITYNNKEQLVNKELYYYNEKDSLFKIISTNTNNEKRNYFKKYK